MNHSPLILEIMKKKVIAKLVIVLITLFLSIYIFLPPSMREDLKPIDRVEIVYRSSATQEESMNSTIERRNGTYYSDTGQKIDAQLLSDLSESLTDLYESEKYEYKLCYLWGIPSFTVVVTYPHEEVILKSNSRCPCFIPWNVEYRGKTYVQYNGKIPSALLKILVNLDTYWLHFGKEARLGCLPGEIPDNYGEKGVSPDFPESISSYLPEEKEQSRILWRLNVDDFLMCPPLYADGRIFSAVRTRIFCFDDKSGKTLWVHDTGDPLILEEDIRYIEGRILVTTEGGLLCLDADTGEKLWEVRGTMVGPPKYWNQRLFIRIELEPSTNSKIVQIICLNIHTGKIFWELGVEEQKKCPVIYGENILFHENNIYFGTGEPSVYCLDAESGNTIWKYEGNASPWLENSGKYLLAIGELGKGVTCLIQDTGEKVWEISDMKFGSVYGDRIFLEKARAATSDCLIWSDPGSQYDMLVDRVSGEPLWIGDISESDNMYKNGILYFRTDQGKTVAALDMQAMANMWSYPFKKEISRMYCFDEGILVSISNEQGCDNIMKLSFLNLEGQLMWEYCYEDSVQGNVDALVNGDNLILLGEKGFVEALNVRNGIFVWKTEIRGSKPALAVIMGKELYLSANDGASYCLNMKNGVISWRIDTESGFRSGGGKFIPHFFEITDDILFSYTDDGNILAISRIPLFGELFFILLVLTGGLFIKRRRL